MFYKEFLPVHAFIFSRWVIIFFALLAFLVGVVAIAASRIFNYVRVMDARREKLTPKAKQSGASIEEMTPQSTEISKDDKEPAKDRLRVFATAITTRLVESAIRRQFNRQDLALISNADESAMDEDDMVQDALNLALGDDTGCLTEEEETPENIDVMFVEEILEKLEREMRDRCFHDFIRLLSSAQNDPPTEDGKIAIQCFGAGVLARGPWGLGSGKCNCGDPDCPYIKVQVLYA
jgi:hypothetical protein